MRTVIAGGRDAPDLVAEAVAASGFDITVVLCGDARGADQHGERWAAAQGIPVEHYPADWGAHGKAAGPRRNDLMASRAQQLVALWDGESRGTRHMIACARHRGLRVYVHRYEPRRPQ